MPLSPFFANLLLKPFDSYIESRGLKMVRYADDFVIFSKNEEGCQKIHGICKSALHDLNLKIPEIEEHTKTKVYPPNKSADFLGIGLVKSGREYKMVVLPEQVNKIKTKFFQFSNFEYLIDNDINLSTLNKKIDGSIAGYIGSYQYADNISDLEAKLVSYKNDVLTRIYSDGLSIDIDKLTLDQRYFLGLN